MFKPLHTRTVRTLRFCAATAALCAASSADAGEFSLDWGVIDWVAGSLAPLTTTLRDQYGFEIDARIAVAGDFITAAGIASPDDATIFGGNVESLVLLADAPANAGRVGDSTVSTTISFSYGGIAFPVDGLVLDIVDVDASDNNASSDRCDFITVTGDNGNPTLTAVTATPTMLVGPGVGSGNTGVLASNQAQCIYIEGTTVSPTSPNDANGTVRATFPASTSTTTIFYDESIGNVRFDLFYDPAARGIGVLSAADFTVDQSITLDRSVSPVTAIQGETVTYTYTVTNTGALPFNPDQDIIIQDDLLGTVSCPAITAQVAPGGTVTCTAPYTITAGDVLTGAVDSNATAGIGTIGQPFVARLQSNTQPLSLTTSVLSTETGPQNCTPQSIFAQPRTQLAGSGSAAALTTSDVFLFDNVTTDINGNPIDIVFQLTGVSNATSITLDTSLDARMVPAQNGYVTYSLRLVQDGTANPSNPQGTVIEQSRIGGIIVQQTDVDSRDAFDDSSDVVGPLLAPDTISHFNTAPLVTFSTGGQPIAMDPAKVGDPTNWVDEANETAFDNYATYEYTTFVEGGFIHGYTGTSTNAATRGSGILLCAVANTSAQVVAEDDDYTATPLNAVLGGTAGEVLANDTINGLPATFPTATLQVLTEAVPQTTGDPVPGLETSGADAGRVIVPPGVPAGTYTIEYQLCDSLAPAECDRAKVTVAVFDGNGLDFGDAPVSYLIASHGVDASPSVYLGSVPPDIEIVAQSDASATADDLLDIDDEDAVTFPVLTQGMISTLEVPVTGTGFLQAWIDFNGDGVFEGTLGESIAVDLRDDGTAFDNVAGDGVIQIDVSVPSDATTSTTFARFRYSSEAGLPTASFAVDGEVEDYSLVIAAADLVDRGDAPASYGDPRHAVVPEIYLGASEPDTEVEPQHSPLGDADDLAGVDDEDAIAVFPVLEAGTTVPLTIQTHETLSLQLELGIPVTEGITNLQLWIDWDQSGTFEPSEQIATDFRDGGAGDTDGVFNNQISVDISVPSDIGNGTTFARVRWSTSSAFTSDPFDGLNFDGEVEDYLVTLSNPQGPLQCSDTFYMIATETAQNLPALSEMRITESGGTYSLTQNLLPPNYTGNYLVTGWGYNELDGYIYGVRQSPRSLMRINASGQVTEVADLSALAIESPDTSSDILPNGIMVYMSGTNFGHYQLLDISDPANPVALGILDTGQSTIYGRDIAYNPRDGLLYFIDPNRDIYALDPLGGTPGATTVTFVGNVPLPSGYFSIDMDSVWFDGAGFLYAFDNQSRQVFAVEVGSGGNRPPSFSFIEVQGTVANLTYQGNDGASCRAPGPFVSTVFQEGSISGTLYQDANSSGSFDAGDSGLPAGITVSLLYDAGTPADPVDDILVTSVETTAGGSYLFSNVNATLSYRIEVDISDPEIPASLSISTANPITGVTVTTGAETFGQDFGFEAAAAAADLSLTKIALNTVDGSPITSASAGEELDFVLTVSSEGPGNASDVRVRDLIPGGFVYISDDAAALGDSYDPGTGLWLLGDVAAGSSHSLTIRVTMLDSGEHTNLAEIVASSLPDPDSDPTTGALVDDLSDGLADDDEAVATVAFNGTGATLSGIVFFDNGAGATAYDGLREGTETGTDRATLQVFDGNGTLIDTPTVASDGSWNLSLPDGYTDPVTVALAPDAGVLTVSETSAALPGLANSDPRDGSFSFTPVPGTSYAGLDFGVIAGARLNESQESAIRAGQVVALRHEYIAEAPSSVVFDIDLESSATPGAFSTALYLDTECDGAPDTPITGPLATDTGTLICLVARVTASGAAAQGMTYSFDLVADTTYGSSGQAEQHRNTDRLKVDAAQGTLRLTKTVRNITQGTPEGVTNGAAAGDVLEYRIYVENIGTVPASEIMVYDKTPPYTVLSSAIPDPQQIDSDVVCTVDDPIGNNAGYEGNLRWACSGVLQPGSTGSVIFQVRIE